jgi:Family of unknown function (DUF6789)
LTSWLARALRGGAAGVAATAAMSVVQLAARAGDTSDDTEPELITETSLQRAGVGLPEAAEDALSVWAHLAFGTACGAAYALVEPALPPRIDRVGAGAAFGLLVATLSYEVWVPRLGALPPLHRQRPRRRWPLLAAHVVYGIVLGVAVGRQEAPTR